MTEKDPGHRNVDSCGGNGREGCHGHHRRQQRCDISLAHHHKNQGGGRGVECDAVEHQAFGSAGNDPRLRQDVANQNDAENNGKTDNDSGHSMASFSA